MKQYVYALQVNPEYQETPFDFIGTSYDDITIAGNDRLYSVKTDLFETVYNALHNDYCMMDDFENAKREQEMKQEFEYYFPGHKYTYDKLADIYDALTAENGKTVTENDTICKIMTVLSGTEYTYRMICGTCQSDWNYCYYPVNDEQYINNIEMEYFNTGLEFRVIYSDNPISSVSELDVNDGDYYYIHHYQERQIIDELADCIGADPENITLFMFDHVVNHPETIYRKYTETEGK